MVKRSYDPEDDDVNVEDDGMEEEEEVEDDEDDEDNDRRRRKKSKKKKKVRIMGDSKQTDADRRSLRQKQRELHNDIALGGDAAAALAGGTIGGGEGDGDDSLRKLRALNNELWQDVRYTREAVLDSDNVDLIANKAARHAEKIVQVSSYFLCCMGLGQGLFVSHPQTNNLFVLTNMMKSGSTIRRGPSGPGSRQEGYSPHRFVVPVRLAWPWLSGGCMLQLSPTKCILSFWSNRC